MPPCHLLPVLCRPAVLMSQMWLHLYIWTLRSQFMAFIDFFIHLWKSHSSVSYHTNAQTSRSSNVQREPQFLTGKTFFSFLFYLCLLISLQMSNWNAHQLLSICDWSSNYPCSNDTLSPLSELLRYFSLLILIQYQKQRDLLSSCINVT